MTSSSIPSLLAGPITVIVGVNGAGFRPFATARWNGAARPTVVTSANQVLITLLPGDSASTADVATGVVTIVNPDGQVSNALAIPIVSSRVGAVQSRLVTPGNNTSVSTAPSTAGLSRCVGDADQQQSVEHSGDGHRRQLHVESCQRYYFRRWRILRLASHWR